MKRLAFDFETRPIGPGCQFPEAICMSWANVEGNAPVNYTIGASGVLRADAGISLLTAELRQDTLLIGAATAFDLLVAAWSAPSPPEMIRLILGAIVRKRVTDVLLRQALGERSLGVFAHKFNLGAVSERAGGRQLNKNDPWRVRFGELAGLQPSEYPAEARRYSLDDALATADCWISQERMRERGSPVFPGYDILQDEFRQQLGALALKDLSGFGLRANPATVAKFSGINRAQRRALRRELAASNLVRREIRKNTDAIAAYAASIGAQLPRTPSGRLSLSRAALLRTGDATLESIAAWPASAEALAAAGLADVSWHKCTKNAAERLVAAFAAQRLPPPMTVPPQRKKGEPGDAFVQRLAQFTPRVKLDNDACYRSKDSMLVAYAKLSSLDTLLGSPTEMARIAADGPMHAHYRPFQRTGRTSSGADEDAAAKGNAQNMHRSPGVREQYEPRNRAAHPALFAQLDDLAARGVPVCTEDRLYVVADYSMVELYAFAQICKWVLGWSVLGDKLISGLDVHLELAADIEDTSYADALARKKEARIAEARTAGKGINFGRKADMSARRFVEYAWNNYRISLGATPKEALAKAQRLVQLHDQRTPEYPHYSRWVRSFQRDPRQRDTPYDLVHPYSGRCVAGLSHTDAHNYPFQGLASDIGKRALAEVFRARWGYSDLGAADPLHGCGLVQFPHDELVCEVAVSKARAGAHRLSELMGRAARHICPDYPSPAEPCIQRQLSKLADPIKNEAGALTGEPWDVWGAATKARDKLTAAGCSIDRLRSELEDQKWPSYVISDVVEAVA